MNKQSENCTSYFPGLAGESLVLLAKSSEHFPFPISAATLQRYWRHGIRGNKLATILLGGRRFTSLEEISRWVARSSTVSGDDDDVPIINPPPKRNVEAGRKKFNLPPSGRNGTVAE
jgi:hypothetical protein